MSIPGRTLARMLVDINVPAVEVRRLVGGCTPAKLCEIVRHMNVLEMMMGLAKMRVRRTPANQAHVTNWREHPALLAADAAEAALRGFAEVETTVTSGAQCTLQRAGDSRRFPDRARRRADPVRGGRSTGAASGHEGLDHLRRDALGLRHRADLCRRRRHALVQGAFWPPPMRHAASRCASPRAPARRR